MSIYLEHRVRKRRFPATADCSATKFRYFVQTPECDKVTSQTKSRHQQIDSKVLRTFLVTPFHVAFAKLLHCLAPARLSATTFRYFVQRAWVDKVTSQTEGQHSPTVSKRLRKTVVTIRRQSPSGRNSYAAWLPLDALSQTSVTLYYPHSTTRCRGRRKVSMSQVTGNAYESFTANQTPTFIRFGAAGTWVI